MRRALIPISTFQNNQRSKATSENDSDSSSSHHNYDSKSRRQSTKSNDRTKSVRIKLKQILRAKTTDKDYEVGVRDSRTAWANPMHRTYVSLDKVEQDYHRDIGYFFFKTESLDGYALRSDMRTIGRRMEKNLRSPSLWPS